MELAMNMVFGLNACLNARFMFRYFFYSFQYVIH